MKLLILKEKATNETRVAATPETVKDLLNLGITVEVEKKLAISLVLMMMIIKTLEQKYQLILKNHLKPLIYS